MSYQHGGCIVQNQTFSRKRTMQLRLPKTIAPFTFMPKQWCTFVRGIVRRNIIYFTRTQWRQKTVVAAKTHRPVDKIAALVAINCATDTGGGRVVRNNQLFDPVVRRDTMRGRQCDEFAGGL